MTIPWVARVVNGTAPTTTGTQDFVAHGMESCAGAVVVVTYAVANDVLRSGFSQSFGFVDGTNSRCSYSFSRDSVTTSVAKSGGNSTDAIRLVDPATGTDTLVATFDSFVTTEGNGGITLDFTTVDASDEYLIQVYLFGGSNAECLAWRSEANATPTTVTPGFLVDFNITSIQRENANSVVAESHWDPGFSHRVASVPTDGVMGLARMLSDDARTTQETKRGKYSDRLSNVISIESGTDTIGASALIENYTATTFDVAGDLSGSPTTGDFLIGLAVKCSTVADPISVASETDRNTSNASPETNTNAGFKPGFLFVVHSVNNVDNSLKTAMGGGIGATDFARSGGIQGNDENNATTTNADSGGHARLLDAFTHTAGTHLYSTENPAQLSTGYTIEWPIATGTRHYALLTVGEAPHEAIATATSGASTASVTAELVFKAVATATMGAATGSVTAELVFEAVATATAAVATGSVTAELVFEAVATATTAASTGSATAELVFEAVASATSAASTGSVTAELVFLATATATAGAATGSLTASQQAVQIVATAAAMTAAATAELVFEGIISATAAAATGSVTAALALQATIAATAAAATGSVTASQQAVQITATAAPATGAATAELVFLAAATATTAAATGSATAELVFQGVASATTAAATASATALQVFEATITAITAAATGSATASQQAVQITATAAPATGSMTAFTDVEADIASETCLAGELDLSTALAGDLALGTTLAGDRDTSTALAGDRDTTTDLAGSYDLTTELAGEITIENC